MHPATATAPRLAPVLTPAIIRDVFFSTRSTREPSPAEHQAMVELLLRRFTSRRQGALTLTFSGGNR